MTPRSPHDPIAARLVSQALTRKVRGYLRKRGVGDVDEVLGEAREDLLRLGLPATTEEVDKLLFRIAHRRAMDAHREARVERWGKHKPRLASAEPPTTPRDAEYALARLEGLVADNPRHATAFEAMKRQTLAGVSLEESAAAEGIAPATLRQWVTRFRAHARDPRAFPCHEFRHFR
jgi:DNA-directed RNA polymerase specialized sigma24 family protein